MAGASQAQFRQAVIQNELEALTTGTLGAHEVNGDKKTAQLRGRVRRLISEEIEAILSKTAPATTGVAISACPAEGAQYPNSQQHNDRIFKLAPIGFSQIPRKPMRSASTPDLGCLPPIQKSMTTRKMHSMRNDYGGFITDVPDWQVDSSTAPVLPSQETKLSRRMWNSLNPDYQIHPQMSSTAVTHIRHGYNKPLGIFTRPRSDFVRYTEELFKGGNQQVMRKGGGAMKV